MTIFDALSKKQFNAKFAEVLQKFNLRSILLSNSDHLEIINDFFDSILEAVNVGTAEYSFAQKIKFKTYSGVERLQQGKYKACSRSIISMGLIKANSTRS